MKYLPRNRMLWVALGLVASLAVVVAALFVLGGYTPTTTAYIENDTKESVTVDNCADVAVTVASGTRQQISPFADATHSTCTVFQGESDLGTPIGCLYIPSSHGRTIVGAIARVSKMRPTKRSGCV